MENGFKSASRPLTRSFNIGQVAGREFPTTLPGVLLPRFADHIRRRQRTISREPRTRKTPDWSPLAGPTPGRRLLGAETRPAIPLVGVLRSA